MLAVVVLADLLVIFLFAVVSAVARATFGASADVLHTIAELSWEIGGSLVVGAFVGGLLVLYLRKIKVDHGLRIELRRSTGSTSSVVLNDERAALFERRPRRAAQWPLRRGQ